MPKVNQEINLDLLKDSSKEVLVDIVKDYPILWNSNSPEYRNTRFKSKRHAAWKEVASLWRQALRMEQLIEPSDTHYVWKNIKDYYYQVVRKMERGDPKYLTPTWRLYDKLYYLHSLQELPSTSRPTLPQISSDTRPFDSSGIVKFEPTDDNTSESASSFLLNAYDNTSELVPEQMDANQERLYDEDPKTSGITRVFWNNANDSISGKGDDEVDRVVRVYGERLRRMKEESPVNYLKCCMKLNEIIFAFEAGLPT